MRTHYIYLEDKIVDEIPAKSREQARKLFIEKYKEIMEIVKFQKWS